MNNKMALIFTLICIAVIPAALLAGAFLFLDNSLYVALCAVIVTAAGVAAACVCAFYLDLRYTKPLMLLEAFFRNASNKNSYALMDETAPAEIAAAYNTLIETLEHERVATKDEHESLKLSAAELSAENEHLRAIDYNHRLIDSVTGLSNRVAFELHIAEVLGSGGEGGIVLADVDNFLIINKLLGREPGDRLLREIGERMTGIAYVKSFCARYSDDKFVAVIMGGKDDIETYCRCLCEEFKRPLTSGEAVLHVDVGIGAVMFHDGGVEQLLEDVRHAMLRSRETGAGYYFFDDFLRRKAQRQAQILAILRESIIQREVFLVYQPQLTLASGEVSVMEVLMRLKNKELGYISPAEFIPIAEANGLILKLGYWALEAACNFLNRSIYQGMISVNISAVQIYDNGFIDRVIDILERTGINPSRLMLEVKEHIAMASFDRELAKLNRLRALGVGMAMDNFGTVYSSLNQMASLPIHMVKIDRSFITGIFTDRRKSVLVHSIIETAHTLGLTVVAEGVEDDDQKRFLQENGCDMIQGYVFSAPLDEDAVDELVARIG